jgi:hypothetical protein
MSLLIVLYCCAGAFAQVSPQKPTLPISAGNWSQIAELVSTASQPLFGNEALLGNEIAISGDTVVVSNEVTDFEPNGAAAFVFQKPASSSQRTSLASLALLSTAIPPCFAPPPLPMSLLSRQVAGPICPPPLS